MNKSSKFLQPVVEGKNPLVSNSFRWQRRIAFAYGATVAFAYWRVTFTGLFPPSYGFTGKPYFLEVTTLLLLVYFFIIANREFVSALKEPLLKLWVVYVVWVAFGNVFNSFFPLFEGYLSTTIGIFRLTVIMPGFALLLGFILSKVPGGPDSLAKGLFIGTSILCISMLWPDIFPDGWASKGKVMKIFSEEIGSRSPGLFFMLRSDGSIGGGGFAAQFLSYMFALLYGIRFNASKRRTLMLFLLILWFFALSVTMVRTSLVAVSCMFLLYIIDKRIAFLANTPSKTIHKIFWFFIFMGILVAIISTSQTFSRLTGEHYIGTVGAEPRFAVWTNSFLRIVRNPGVVIVGFGLGKGVNAHNFILYYLLGTGIFGLALILYFIKTCYIPIEDIRLTPPSTNLIDGSMVGRYLMVSILIYGMSGNFLSTMESGMMAMLMIGCFVYPQNRLRKFGRVQDVPTRYRKNKLGYKNT